MRTDGDRRPLRAFVPVNRRTAVLAVVGIVVIALLAAARTLPGLGTVGARGPQHATAGPWGTPVHVGASSCGKAWDGGPAGPSSFALRDDGATPVDVYLQDVDSGRIFLDAETIGSGAERAARVSLAAGHYRFVCAGADIGSIAGPTTRITGSYDGPLTRGLLPVTDGDLVGPVVEYQKWVTGRLARLRPKLRVLTRSLVRGNVTAAKRDWLTAHRLYLTLGGAYDAFGDFGQPIDGLPRTGVPPPDDPDLTGFHKIEALLWQGKPAGRALPYATRLDAAVAELQRHFGTDLVLAPLDIGLRAHEILEDALQFDLRDAADAGSHTELASVDAEITGTRHALAPLLPLLRGRDPNLDLLQTWLDRLTRTVRSHRHHGRWTPLEDLSRRERERLDADLSQTLELLADVAVITDPVRPTP